MKRVLALPYLMIFNEPAKLPVAHNKKRTWKHAVLLLPEPAMRLTISIIVIFFACMLMLLPNKDHRLKAKHKLINGGYITGLSKKMQQGETQYNVDYVFTVNGSVYRGRKMFTNQQLAVTDFKKYIAGHSFPVVYEEDEPVDSELLISHADYKYYGYHYPDSMQWALQYMHGKE